MASSEDSRLSVVAADRASLLFKQTRLSLRRTIDRYRAKLHLPRLESQDLQRQATIKAGVDQLTAIACRLETAVLRVAVFGLVSRGKSAVLNALLGEKILPTGPLNGVTQWPRSVYWKPAIEDIHDSSLPLQLELIDTPGLDEVEGQVRGEMAQTIAQSADLILFVVAGDITQTEYTALVELRQLQKPLLLVFNKIDLYPDCDRESLYRSLRHFWQKSGANGSIEALLPDEIVRVAAEPAPYKVRVEWPDGQIREEWETPGSQITELNQALLGVAQHQGRSLMMLNALSQARQIDATLAQTTVELQAEEADQLILRFAKYKALAVALNPVAVLDLMGGVAADLWLIRSLAHLYGLPMTGHEANRLWRTIVRSSGALILSELGSGLLLGLGKSAAAAFSVLDSPSGLVAYTGAMTAQAGAAGYGTYAIGQAAKRYLAQGCSWGPQGVGTVMQEILQQLETETHWSLLQTELRELLHKTAE